jgi:hypothetical protein
VAAAAVFLGCLAVQYLGYERLLASGLRAPAIDARQRAMKRWLLFVVAWQSVVIVGVLAYIFAMTRPHRPPGLSWIAPPVAAMLGTALPLQLAAARLMRAGRE